MGQQVKVFRDLQFLGSSKHTDNVEGNISLHKVVHYEEFTGKAIDATNDYTVTADAGCGATIVAPHLLRLTKDADNEGANFATGLDFYGQYNAVCEARIRMTDISAACLNFGFCDAQDDQPPFSATGATPTLTSTTSDAAMFLYDYDCTTKNIYGVSVKADADGAIIDSGHAEADTSWATYRVELRDNGTTTDAIFYLNTAGKEIDPANDLVGIEADALTRTTALCVMVGLEGREAGTDTADIDYIKVWSDRQ